MATYGIDLGTTYSCIAYVDGTGRPVVLKSAVGEDTTPSVVYFESPDNVVVGRQAKDSALLAPHLVVELVKRQMGEDVHYSFHGQDHTPESISALILRELARAAQQQTGEEVRDVVITVPAYFGLLEREATRKAGQIAGLNVLDVLAEPVAAALNYQVLDQGEGQPGVRHIFIYDLGGGTFDTTVIRIDGDDIQVVCTDGNHHLGGADWDSAIIDFLLRGFTEQYPAARSGRRRAVHAGPGDLRRAAEEGAQRHPDAQAQRPVRRLGRAARTDQGAPRGAHLRAARADHGDHRADDRHRAGEGRRTVRRRAPGGRHDHHAGHRADAQGAVRAGRQAAGSAPGRGQGRRAVRPHEEGQGEHAG